MALDFIYLLTFGAAIISLSYPFAGLLVYVCFGVIKPEYLFYDAVPANNYSRIIALAVIAGWMIHGFGSWRFRSAGATAAAFAGFWLWAILSACIAPDHATAWGFVADMGKFVLPFLIGLSLIDSIVKLKALAWVIVLSQALIAGVLELNYLGGFNRMQEIGFGGFDNNSAAIGMVTCAGVAFFLGLGERRWDRRAIALVAALLLAHIVLISGSRGGMLGLVSMAAAGFWLLPRHPASYAATALALILLVGATTNEARERFQSGFADEEHLDDSARSRLELWANNFDVMLKNPVFGCGPHHWPLVANEYGWHTGKEGHSLWLQTAAELGIPGVALLASFYGITLVRLSQLLRAREQIPDPWLADCARMVIVALVGFIVAAQFVTISALEVPYYVVLLGAGALKLASKQEATEIASAPQDADERIPAHDWPRPNSPVTS